MALFACLAVVLAGCETARTATSGTASSGPLMTQARTDSFGSAVDTLVSGGYPQRVVTHLAGLGDTVEGFRLAGGRSDVEASAFIAAEMRSAGLQRVRLEPIAVDVWEMRGAEVVVDGDHITASQWAGVPGTLEDGITAPLVYVRSGLAADYQVAGDVNGRIVLVDLRPSDFWVGALGMEAKAHGAAGMILTSTRRDTSMFGSASTLASSSATYSTTGAVPFVFVCRRDGDRLRRLSRNGATVTVRSEVAVTTASQGGVAYNVIGEIRGARAAAGAVIVGAHQDAFFEGAVDNASGVAGLLTMARAMTMCGYRPERTIIFVSHTAEEFGSADSQYDWCIGSWRLMREHADWPGRVSAELELDEIGYRRAPLWALNPPELGRWLRKVDRPGARVWPQDWITSYSDQWAYAARGIPSIHFGNSTDAYDARINHTDADVPTLINFRTLGDNVTTVFRAVKGLDVVSRRLLPYAPLARVEELRRCVSVGELRQSGCGSVGIRRYERALGRLSRAAGAYDARAKTIRAGHVARVNTGLVLLERDLNRGLTALDWYDSATYPHRAQLDDLQALDAAIQYLRAGSRAAALKALCGVTHTATGRHLSVAVYRRFLQRLTPEDSRLNWAAWARLPLTLDVMPEYRLIERGRYAEALISLTVRRREARRELERRLVALCHTLTAAAERLDTLR